VILKLNFANNPTILGNILNFVSLSIIIPMNLGIFDMKKEIILENSNETLIILAKDLGQLIKSARKAAKIPIDQAALLAGVSKQFFSDVEHGKPTLQFEKVVSVARQFGVELIARPRGLSALEEGVKNKS
jgi:hypothetical protein